MTNSNNRQPLRIALAAAVVLAVVAAWMAWVQTPASRSPAVPAVAPVAPHTAPVATQPDDAPVKPPAVASKPQTLDEMKQEFADLMKKRAGLFAKSMDSQKQIVASRVTTDRSAPANAATAEAYRQKVLELEHALDAHPRILAIQALYDVAQTDKVAVSRQQSVIISTWQVEELNRKDRWQDTNQDYAQKEEALMHELLKNAGVKDLRKLSKDDQKRLSDFRTQSTNLIIASEQEYLRQSDTNAVEAAHIRDGSSKRLDDYNVRYAELEKQQDELNKQMQKLRDDLRRTDPGIMKLQQETLAASQRHLAAMEAQPEVAAARKFLGEVDALRAVIDQRARVLRKAILAAEPAYKPTMDQQAIPGGLAQVGEDFWNVEG